jgi:two-component system OmpR family response regulator
MENAMTSAEDSAQAARLLVVDDEPDNLELLVRLFQRHGCEVVAAANGTDALRLASAQQPHLT